MKIRKIDTNGDIHFGYGDADFISDSAQTVAQKVVQRLRLWEGEWFLDVTAGTPWKARVLGRKYSKNIVQIIKQRIEETEGVQSVSSLDVSFDGNSRNLKINAHIMTEWGGAIVSVGNEPPSDVPTPTPPPPPLVLPSSLTLGCLAFFPCDDEYEAVHGEAWTKGTDYSTAEGKIGSGIVETRYNTNTGLRHAYDSTYPQFSGAELAQRTLAAWVKITVNNSNSPLLVVRWSGGNAYGFSVASDKFGEYYADGNFDSLGRFHTLATPIPENEWHHFAYTQNTYTLNGNTVVREFKYYFDGELVETKTSGSSAVSIVNADHMIGSHRGWAAQSSGVIDEVGVWQRALSDAEIKALYDAGNAGVTYPFEGYCPIDGGEVHLLDSLQRMLRFNDDTYDEKADETFTVLSGSNSFVTGILDKAISEPKLKGTFSVPSPDEAGEASAFSWIFFESNPGGWGGGLFGPAGSKTDGTMEVCNPAKNRAGITIGKYVSDGNYALEGIIYRAAKYISINEWHLVGYTWNGSILKVYLDGYKIGECESSDWTETIDSSHWPFVGRTATQPGTQFEGIVDDTAYWTRALNESEILALWNEGQGLPFEDWT